MKKIAILFWENRDIESYPSIINAAELWVKHGYSVEILLPEAMRSKYKESGITIHYFGVSPYEYIYAALTHLRKTEHEFYIAYDDFGLFLATKTENKTPIIFHSLEIVGYKPKSLKSLLRSYKTLLRLKLPSWGTFERKRKERILFSIVQDPDREKLLREIYGFIDKVILVPNSNLGIYDKKSDYLRRKYNIHKNKKIILYSGAIEKWALTEEIVKAAIKWPEDWVFVLHGFNRGDLFHKQVEPLIQEHNKKTYMALEFLDKNEYNEMVSSADIGLAWYRKTLPENVYRLGASSGKFFQYLYCGLPVIAPDYIPSIKNIIDLGKIGECASCEDDIHNSICEIFNNYDVYKQNVHDFYLKYYEFESKYLAVIKEYNRNIE